ncbi:hypothetical protein Q8W40_13830 [Vibrio penaeicida]|uniref:hypothetical protein n=1 Tax=Vibrio penaeicida TaxID=104609 RepID=UPI0027339791|nr:hypothetical protein [Vibrio penaeicida]MDP2573266.1 hypothetical protein [Vibrio penaeicida]
MKMIYGVHGTSFSRAELIENKGFQQDKFSAGRHGKGVYLWAYDPERPDTHSRAELLGRHWHNMRFDKNAYKDCVKKSCAVLSCRCKVLLLDLEAAENYPTLRAFMEKISSRLSEMVCPAKVSKTDFENIKATKAYDLFVEMKKEEDDVAYNAIHVKTKAPQSYVELVTSQRRNAPSWEVHTQVTLDSCYVIHDTDVVEILENKNYPPIN